MRLADRMDMPSTSISRSWARLWVGSLFIPSMILHPMDFVKHFVLFEKLLAYSGIMPVNVFSVGYV